MGRTSAAKNSIKAAARVFLMRNVGYTERGSSGGAIMELTIYVKKIVRAMIIAVLLITLVSFVARVAMYIWGQEGYLQPLRIFDVGEERSIPTWFESMQFLLCSILLAVIGVAKKRRSDRYTARCSGSEPMRTWSHERLLRRPQTQDSLLGRGRHAQGPGGSHLLREPLLGQTIRKQGPKGR